jgi:hypothetical protein
MAIYDRPTHSLMHDFAKENLTPGATFSKQVPVAWFREKYPKIKEMTVRMHVDGMSVNSHNRKHAPNIKPGLDWDLFYKLGDGKYRLYDPASDPKPVYRNDLIAAADGRSADEDTEGAVDADDEAAEAGTSTFAYEHHLRDYLARNLNAISPGLRLYEDDGFTGVEFPVGGRFIDVLAVDSAGDFVVIELKVSRGYDRAIGQILRYMGWIEKNLAGNKRVRGVIVANEISEDLKLAASRIQDVSLMEYEISFQLKPIAH